MAERREIQKGKKRQFYILFPDETEPKLLEAQSDGSINISNGVQTITTFKDDPDANWEQAIDGMKNWSASVSFGRPEEGDERETQEELLNTILTGETTEVKVFIGYVGGTVASPTFTGYEGSALIESYEESYPLEDIVTGSASLKGIGALKTRTTALP